MGNTNKNLLIVEDNDDLRIDLKDFLMEENFNVTIASNGYSAINFIVENDYDIILTDYKMEPFGGSIWMKFLKKFLKSTKVIIISGFLKPDEPIDYPIIYKPFHYKDLLDQLNKL